MGRTFGKFWLLSAALVVAMAICAQAQSGKKAASDELDIAIRDASDYLNDNIPKGSKIVILNIESVSANLSEYIIDELIANAVNDKMFSVVDRRQLETIRAEQKFQMSGAVDDKDALEIGKLFGAQTIISGTMRDIGGRFRMTIRALAVQTAQVQGQYNRNMPISQILTGLANSGGSNPTSGVAAYGATTTTPTALAKTATPAEPPIQGIAVPGESLADKLAWLTRSADSHNTYIVEVNADESIAPHTFEFKGGINITIVLRGDNEKRTIRLQSNGTMFTVNTNVTLILDNNITLQGHNSNNSSMVAIGPHRPRSSSEQGGVFKMRTGSTITGNNGGGVYFVVGTFEMSGGTISNNIGCGVYVGRTMLSRGNFIMTGGTISGNTATTGGGVCVDLSANFTMRGGTITNNTARKNGGGVYVNPQWSNFTKTGGIITGYSSDQTNGNVVRDEDGNMLARRGHAVWVNENLRKETTSGPKENLSNEAHKNPTGAWDGAVGAVPVRTAPVPAPATTKGRR